MRQLHVHVVIKEYVVYKNCSVYVDILQSTLLEMMGQFIQKTHSVSYVHERQKKSLHNNRRMLNTQHCTM